MAEDTSNPSGGSVPPKPAEAAKVQPKKETVRITLPPKPSASPTIKLPTLPAGGAPAPAASVAAKPAAAPVTAGAKAPPPPVRPGGATLQRQTAAPASGVGSAAPRRPMAPVQPVISAADRGLAIGAAVASLLALAGVLILLRFQ